MEEFRTLIQETNIEVLKCYNDISNFKYYSKNAGSFIMLGLIFSQIILVILYCKIYIFAITKYLYNLMSNFISFLSKKGNHTHSPQQIISTGTKLIENKEAPQKRKIKHLYTRNYMKENNIISHAKSEIGEHKKLSKKKGNKNDAKSEIPNRDKLRLNTKSEISVKEENEIKIEDDLISDVPNDIKHEFKKKI